MSPLFWSANVFYTTFYEFNNLYSLKTGSDILMDCIKKIYF